MLVPPENRANLCLPTTVLTLVNIGKITIFRSYPSATPSFEGNLLTQRYEIWSQKLDTLRNHINLTWTWFGTGMDTKTDGRTLR